MFADVDSGMGNITKYFWWQTLGETRYVMFRRDRIRRRGESYLIV